MWFRGVRPKGLSQDVGGEVLVTWSNLIEVNRIIIKFNRIIFEFIQIIIEFIRFESKVWGIFQSSVSFVHFSPRVLREGFQRHLEELVVKSNISKTASKNHQHSNCSDTKKRLREQAFCSFLISPHLGLFYFFFFGLPLEEPALPFVGEMRPW